jgi:hypothetical protein
VQTYHWAVGCLHQFELNGLIHSWRLMLSLVIHIASWGSWDWKQGEWTNGSELHPYNCVDMIFNLSVLTCKHIIELFVSINLSGTSWFIGGGYCRRWSSHCKLGLLGLKTKRMNQRLGVALVQFCGDDVHVISWFSFLLSMCRRKKDIALCGGSQLSNHEIARSVMLLRCYHG